MRHDGETIFFSLRYSAHAILAMIEEAREI